MKLYRVFLLSATRYTIILVPKSKKSQQKAISAVKTSVPEAFLLRVLLNQTHHSHHLDFLFVCGQGDPKEDPLGYIAKAP